MSKPQADIFSVSAAENALKAMSLEHLRVRKHGNALILESGPKGDPFRHARLRRDTVHLWLLDIANHRGQWERTPFRATIGELITLLAETFPWIVAPIETDSERTSDPEY